MYGCSVAELDRYRGKVPIVDLEYELSESILYVLRRSYHPLDFDRLFFRVEGHLGETITDSALLRVLRALKNADLVFEVSERCYVSSTTHYHKEQAEEYVKACEERKAMVAVLKKEKEARAKAREEARIRAAARKAEKEAHKAELRAEWEKERREEALWDEVRSLISKEMKVVRYLLWNAIRHNGLTPHDALLVTQLECGVADEEDASSYLAVLEAAGVMRVTESGLYRCVAEYADIINHHGLGAGANVVQDKLIRLGCFNQIVIDTKAKHSRGSDEAVG